MYKFKIILPLLLSMTFLSADEKKFSLDDALKLASKQSFDQKDIKENINLKKIGLQKVNDSFFPDIFLDTRLGEEENMNDTVGDSFGYVVWNNNLYNKKSNILSKELKKDVLFEKRLLEYSQKKRKIDVMKAFFDAKLADMYQQYTIESLAMDAIKSNRAKDYYSTGRVSDITILKTQTKMLFASANNSNADQKRYLARTKLANLLEVDFQKVYNLKKPNLKAYWSKKILESEALIKLANKKNIILKSMQLKLDSINEKLLGLKNNLDFQLTSTVKYGIEKQKTLNVGDTRWEARFNLKIPLYDKHHTRNKIRTMQIQKNKQLNKIAQYKFVLINKISTLVVMLNNLKKLHAAYAKQLEFRNLYLDKARVNYDLDRQSDLGDSMAMLTKAEYEYSKNEYAYVLTYEMLQLIIGEQI